MAETKKVVIIGGGPAGVAAAIQLARYDIHPLMIEKDQVGGLLRNANLVENYPGFPSGIRGVDLVQLFRQQLQKSKVVVAKDEVLNLCRRDSRFLLECGSRTVEADIVVIASGTKPRPIPGLSISGEAGTRVLSEPHPLRGVEGKIIAVIGSGDAAFDYASGLLEKNKVVIINRGRTLKCQPILRDRVRKSSGATCMEGVELKRVRGVGEKLLLEYSAIGAATGDTIEADYLLIAVGRDPFLDFVDRDLLEKIEASLDSGQVHLIGDVKNGMFRQVGISVGDGLRAAMRISQDLVGERI